MGDPRRDALVKALLMTAILGRVAQVKDCQRTPLLVGQRTYQEIELARHLPRSRRAGRPEGRIYTGRLFVFAAESEKFAAEGREEVASPNAD